MSESLNDCSGLFLKIMRKDERKLKLTQALGLRSVMRQAGLLLLRRKSFLWTDDGYGAYTRELLTRFTESAREGGIVSEEEAERFLRNLEVQSSEGEFYYGIAYHLIAAAR